MNTTSDNAKTWEEQNALGREIALNALKKCQDEENPTLLLREFEQHITETTDRGVTVGFFHQLAESFMALT